MKLNRTLLAMTLAPMAMLAASTAHADGNVRCDSGPRENWKPLVEARKKAWLEGWAIQKVQVEGDCYEIYARTEGGQAIEAFFHPVTLQKLVVYRRGREIYRAPSFKPR